MEKEQGIVSQLAQNDQISQQIPECDLTIADIMRIAGISKDKAYSSIYYGEYRVGKQRRIRREVFVCRRSRGENICKCK